LHGDLAVLARFAQEGERRSAGDTARLSVVAGVRNHLYRTFFKCPYSVTSARHARDAGGRRRRGAATQHRAFGSPGRRRRSIK
jgi:hypothetical protein